MSRPTLPHNPVTTVEVYLYDIAFSLRELVDALQQPPLPPSAEPELIGTPLPEDFPGRDALAEAGIITLEEVPTDGDALVAIKGIGQVTAGQILGALT